MSQGPKLLILRGLSIYIYILYIIYVYIHIYIFMYMYMYMKMYIYIYVYIRMDVYVHTLPDLCVWDSGWRVLLLFRLWWRFRMQRCVVD